MKFFILTTTDSEDIDGKRVPAYQIALERLENGLWPLYENTKNKFLVSVGHKCLIYIGGDKQEKQKIIGQIVVKEIRPYSSGKDKIDQVALTDLPERVIVFENPHIFTNSIEIRPLLDKLKFIKKQKRWGVMLMGGCKPIPDEDYELLINQPPATQENLTR